MFTESDLMIESQLGISTQGVHENVTDGVDSIQRQIMESLNQVDEVTSPQTPQMNVQESEEVIQGTIDTLDNVIARYINKFNTLKTDYSKAIAGSSLGEPLNDGIVNAIGEILMSRDSATMNVVVTELTKIKERLNTMLLNLRQPFFVESVEEGTNNIGTEDIEDAVDAIVEEAMDSIEQQVQVIKQQSEEQLGTQGNRQDAVAQQVIQVKQQSAQQVNQFVQQQQQFVQQQSAQQQQFVQQQFVQQQSAQQQLKQFVQQQTKQQQFVQQQTKQQSQITLTPQQQATINSQRQKQILVQTQSGQQIQITLTPQQQAMINTQSQQQTITLTPQQQAMINTQSQQQAVPQIAVQLNDGDPNVQVVANLQTV